MKKNKSFSKNIHPWSGRKCALCELSLTNKNNIIMKIVHQKYCPYHNDEDTKYIQTSHIYCRTHFPVCIPRSVAVGGDQIMSYVAAKVFICFYRSCCSVPWRGRRVQPRMEHCAAQRICQLFHEPFV